jgi:hypothetical protein
VRAALAMACRLGGRGFALASAAAVVRRRATFTGGGAALLAFRARAPATAARGRSSNRRAAHLVEKCHRFMP